MREVSETASTLTIHHPMWIGVLILAAAYILAARYIWAARKSSKPREQVAVGIFGMVIGSALGFGMLVPSTTMDATGASHSVLLAGAESVAWKDVAAVTLESRRAGRRGEQPHLILRRSRSGELAAEISGLDADETARVLAFARARAAGR